MKEYRSQLEKIGETIAESIHVMLMLKNVPESWRSIAQTIRMIAHTPNEIEERLKAHEADLNALKISTQAATAFIAHQKPNKSTHPSPSYLTHSPTLTTTPYPSQPPPIPTPAFNNQNFQTRPQYSCNNCGRPGHSASRCFSSGGSLAGQAPWRSTQGESIPITQPLMYHSSPSSTVNQSPSQPNKYTTATKAQLAAQPPDYIMATTIIRTKNKPANDICININTTALSIMENSSHTWFPDYAASSHLSGNLQLFHTIHSIPPITIKTARSKSFTANQQGTVHIKITSDPLHKLPVK